MEKTAAKGLNAFQLKIIALVVMTIDHIAEFIPGAPPFLRVIGRIAAPIFFFLCAETMRHTRSREKYLLRLYVFSVVMELGKILLSRAFGAEPYQNNIFATLFFAALIIYAFATISDVRNETAKKPMLIAAFLALAFVVVWAIVYGKVAAAVGNEFALAVLPQSPLDVEGGIFWVLLAVGFYLLPGRGGAIILLVFLSGGLLAGIMTTEGTSWQALFLANPQWLMILALPFLLLYNGQRGRGMKWLFYTYYPLHIWLLYIIGVLMSK